MRIVLGGTGRGGGGAATALSLIERGESVSC